MADTLSPEEIEALLTSLAADEAEGDVGSSRKKEADRLSDPRLGAGIAASSSQASHKKLYETYDFRRPDKLSKDQLRTLQMLHETFARLASSGFAAFLRTPVQVELVSLEQVPYEEYIRSIDNSIFAILTLAPLSGQSVMELEFGLAFSMMDRMLGGAGTTLNRTVLTEIERPLITQLIERALAALKHAWEAVVLINPTIDSIETSAQFVNIAPTTDIVVTILYEVKIGDQRGAMSLCIPYLVLKPIASKLAGQKWITTSSHKRSAATRRLISHHLGQTAINCHVELGTAVLSIRDFVSLREGDVFRLDRKTNEDLLLCVGNSPKFAGTAARRGKKLAFKVTRRIASPWETD